MTDPARAQALEVAVITHDLAKRRSLVLLTWPGDPERRLSLPVPFDTGRGDAVEAARAALRDLAREIETADVVLAGG